MMNRRDFFANATALLATFALPAIANAPEVQRVVEETKADRDDGWLYTGALRPGEIIMITSARLNGVYRVGDLNHNMTAVSIERLRDIDAPEDPMHFQQEVLVKNRRNVYKLGEPRRRLHAPWIERNLLDIQTRYDRFAWDRDQGSFWKHISGDVYEHVLV